jgi:flagellar motor component MotA
VEEQGNMDDPLTAYLVALDEKARREGLLSLTTPAEDTAALAAGLRAVVAGGKPEVVRRAMEEALGGAGVAEPVVGAVLALRAGDGPAAIRDHLRGR